MSLLTLGILGIVSIIILITGFFIENDDWSDSIIIFGMISIIVIGVGGFGLHATINYDKMIVTSIKPDNIIKTDSRVIMEFDVDGEIENVESEKIIDYTTINDSTKFYLVRYYNYYGYENHKEKHFITYNKMFSNVEKGKKVEPIKVKWTLNLN